MLLRVAAWCVAAFLIAVPASAGIETGVVADANLSATANADAPMGVAATTIDARQEKIEAKAEGANGSRIEPQPVADAPVQANIPAAIQPTVQAGVSPDIQKQDQIEASAPAKLAALEPVAPDQPNAVLPRAEMPRNELPHIDAAFRFYILPVDSGDVLAKWSGVKADMRAESEIFARCRANMDSCPAAAKRFLGIVDQGRALTGRARIGVINRAVNMAIEPVSDMVQWGVPDRWSAPLETFTTGKGDCEDYAIAKYVALIEAGIAAENVKLMIVRNTAANEDHAVTAVRLDGTWIILDNRWLRLVEDKAMAQAVPLFALGNDDVRQFLADVLVGARRAPAPASIAN
jgi:predicted transglutaminase-like cysteine proteinase